MTPQEVIKSFMASLRDNSSLSGTSMLDAAVKASSKYSGVQDVIDAMKADQIAAEKEAVEEVLGSDYAVQTISDVASGILKATAKTYDTNNIGNAYYNSSNDNRTTVERLIKERKAIIFLEKYCGIQLNNNYWITSSDVVTAYNGDTTGNVDTGAITGSDANITLKAGDEVNGTILTPAIMQAIAEKDGASLSGDTLIIGTGTEKTEYSIVPEIGNKYTATTSQAQNIKTGSNDWIVVATSGNDTITTGGADSVDAGAGSDKIIVGADYASIKTGAGSDTVEISAEVKNITIQDLNSSDLLTISGTFEVGTAKIEDTMLVVTDKTGTRQIRLGDLDNAKNAKVDASTTIANWLTKASIDLNNLPTSSGKIISESIETEASIVNKEDDSGRIAIDPDYTPAPKPVEPTEETENQPHRSSNTTGNVNVNLDNVTLQSGNYNVDGSKVGEISNEFPNISKYTKNGLTIYLAGVSTDTGGDPDKIESKTYEELTADQKTIVAGLFKWWAKEALQLNEESYGISFDSDSAMVKEIGLYFYNSKGSGNTLAAVYNWSTSGTGQNTTKLMLNVNLNYYSGIADTNFDGESSSTSGFLDRTLAHEFTHAIMASNIHYFNSLPQFIKEGSAELTHGIDDERGQPIFGIAYDASRLNNALSLTNTGTGTADAYAGGYMFFRYLARQAALQTLFDGVVIPGDDNPLLITLTANADNYSNTLEGATIMAFDGDDTIENNVVNVTINAGAGNDSIGNHGGYDNGNDLIDAGDGDDTIDNHVHNVTLRGGAGNDSIYNGDTALIEGGEGNDSIISENFNGSPVTINAGAGSDYISLHSGNQSNLILYNSGDGSDTIYGFNGNSTLKFGSGISNYSTIKSGSDIFIMVDANALVLKDAATLSGINIVDNQDNVLEHAPIKGTANADNISNNFNKVSILAYDGDDTIANYGNNVTIDAGNGNDSVRNFGGSQVTIEGGAGNDVLENEGSDVTVNGGADDDYIWNSGKNISISGGTGNDKIFNEGDSITIDAGDGNNTIGNGGGSYVTIKAGAGNDSINTYNGGLKTSVNAGDGNNWVLSDAEGTINAGAGSDSLYGGKVVNAGAGNDTIESGNKNATLDGGDGDDRINTDGENVLMLGGKGNDSLYAWYQSSNVTINGGEGNNILWNEATTASVVGGSGNDTVDNFGANVTIETGAGNDSILSRQGSHKVGENILINAGNGNDWIESGSKNVTVNAGEGNDTIKNTGDNLLIQYAKIDGYDLIQGFNATSTLDLAGAKYATTKSGNDLIINVIDSGNITLAGGATLDALNIIGTYSEDTTPSSAILTLDNASKAAITLDSDIKYANASARTKAIRITGNALDNSIVGGTANDILEGLTGNDTLTGGNGADIFIYTGGNDVITDYAANDKISLASDLTYDNYAISGSDLILGYGTNNSLTIRDGNNKAITFVAGKKSTVNVYTAEGIFDAKKTSVTLAATSGDFDAANNPALVAIDGSKTGAIKITGNAKANNIIAGDNGSTLNGGTGNDILQGGNGSDIFIYDNKSGNKTIVNYDAGDKISLDSNATLADASISKKGDAVLKVSGNTLTVKNSSDKEITLTANGNDIIYNGSVFSDSTKINATLPATFAKEFNLGTFKNADSSSRTGAIKITGNSYSNSIAGGKGNDILDGAGGDDTLTGEAGADIFIYTGGNDVITDYDAKDKISVTSDLAYDNYAISGSDLILGYGANNSLTIKDGNNKAITFVAGKKSTINVYTAEGIFDAKKTSVTLAATSGDFDAANNPALVAIDGSKTGAIKITGNAKANNIIAGDNGSTLNGGTGNDILQGGNGSDIFIYDNKSGNKTIVDYGTGDKISLNSNATLIDASVNKKGDTLLKVGSNTLTVKNSFDKEITLTANGNDIIYNGSVFSDTAKTNATLPATFAKEFNLGTFKNADSSSRTGAIKITGNSYSNSIAGGKGNDILDGAGGDDTLTGEAGADTFVYTGGNDVITDYDAKDKISVTSDLTYDNYAISGSDLILGYGANNSLTIKDGNNKAITFVAGKTSTVNIYTKEGISNPKKTAMTLAAESGDFDATDNPALVVIDGSKTGAIKITGNAKANNIIAGDNGSTLNGGTGNDILQGGDGSDIFIYDNKSGNKTIVNYDAGDKISLDSNATLIDASVNKKGDTLLKVGSNTITIKDTSEVMIISNGDELIYGGGLFSNTAKTNATLPATFAKEFNMGTFTNVDSSLRSGAIKITGNEKNNSIFGGKGNDTLDGATGNDTLAGGAGKNIFIYSNGNDFITDYEAKDKISIDGELVYTNYAINGDNVVLNYSGNNSLTIKDAKDKTITSFTGKKSTVNVYSPEGIFDAKKTVATLASSTTNFDASTDYSALVVIDGSAATEAIKITGNAKANRIIAGNYGSTLNGGIGNDMLIGGNGADIFIYENNSGKKVIDNYGTSDKISLGAGATITDALTKNDVSTIKIGSNFVTLKSSDATFVSDGIETIYSGGIFTIKDTAKVYGSYTGTINLSANVKIADAALASKAVTVQGGTADDSITGGASADKLHGNAGSDTLYGGKGKGNDSLWGGAGNDNFIYKANEGNDIIADYAAGDLVTILDKQGNAGTFSKATFGNNTLTMNINGGGSLTLKDVTSSTNFNINGENYHVDGKTLAK